MTTYTEQFIDNQGVKIQCLITANFNATANNKPPLIMVPGMTNSANDLADDLKNQLQYPHLIVSIRGRGKSDSPNTDSYTFEHQVSDINAAITAFNISGCFIFGFSMGGAMAIRAAANIGNHAKGLIVGDYPPIYPPLSPEWAERVLANPNNQMPQHAVNGIVAQSGAEPIMLVPDLLALPCPILYLSGGKEGAMFPPDDGAYLKELLPTIQTATLPNSDHDLFNPDVLPLIQLITQFIAAGG